WVVLVLEAMDGAGERSAVDEGGVGRGERGREEGAAWTAALRVRSGLGAAAAPRHREGVEGGRAGRAEGTFAHAADVPAARAGGGIQEVEEPIEEAHADEWSRLACGRGRGDERGRSTAYGIPGRRAHRRRPRRGINAGGRARR